MELNIARPSEMGTTIKAELKMSRVIHASTSNSTMRNTKPYLQELNSFIVKSKSKYVANTVH